MNSRNKTFDGLRGCLAMVVMVNHAFQLRGSPALFLPAGLAVWIFFAISGYVLASGWNGRYLEFLVRRAVRLWPVYAVCLTTGAILFGANVALSEYLWLPIATPGTSPGADPPAWSLTIEVWAMPLMPLFVWIGRRQLACLVGAFTAICLVSQFYMPVAMLDFIIAGAWLTRYQFRWALLERAVPQWLGRVSYPLYLCHWPILAGLGLPLWLSVPLAFAVAELLARTLDKWSILASHRAGRFICDLLASGEVPAGA